MSQIQKGTTYNTGDTVSAASLNTHVDGAVLLPGAIGDQSLSAAASADHLLVRDASTGLLKKSTIASAVGSATISAGTSGYVQSSNGSGGFSSPGVLVNVSGNIGIGIASPAARLDVSSPDSGYAVKFIGPSGVPGFLYSDSSQIALINASAVTGVFISTALQKITLAANNAERLTVTSAGNVGIGTSSPSYQLQLSTDSAAKPTSSAWTIASDSRIKKDIKSLNGAESLAKIEQVRPVSFSFIPEYLAETKSADKTYFNFIAQELERVFPECVRRVGYNLEKTVTPEVKDSNGRVTAPAVRETVVENVASVDSHNLIIHLIAAVQELSAKVKALEAK